MASAVRSKTVNLNLKRCRHAGGHLNAGQATVSAVQHDIVAKNLVFEAYLQTLEGEWIVSVSSWKRGGYSTSQEPREAKTMITGKLQN